MTVRIGGQDNWREEYWEKAAEIGLGKGSRDRTVGTGQPEQDSSKKQSGQNSQDRKERKGRPVHYSVERTTGTGEGG
jgi:hypothetical protein